jgi:hypothetical protein
MSCYALENVSSEVMRHGILFDGRASPGISFLLVCLFDVLAWPDLTAFFTLLNLFG